MLGLHQMAIMITIARVDVLNMFIYLDIDLKQGETCENDHIVTLYTKIWRVSGIMRNFSYDIIHRREYFIIWSSVIREWWLYNQG